MILKMKPGSFRMKAFIKKYGGHIAYYAAVALALGIIAIAAEEYRADGEVSGEQLILPAVEIDIAQPEPEPVLFQPMKGMRKISTWSNKPNWNHYLGCWQTHPGTDYACEDDAVYSLSEGTVKTVGKSGVYGGFVEVETGEYMLKYASLENMSDLQPGQKLKIGDFIGSASDCMPSEANLDAHLHLEAYLNGENINADDLLN